MFTSTQALAQEVTYYSPHGIQEVCRILPPMPGASYSEKDKEDEQELCAVDLYEQSRTVICPKVWSTSAAVVAYDITEATQDEIDRARSCPSKGKRDQWKRDGLWEGISTAYKLKPTMNMKGTSGTFSQASLMYYHFSRYFDTAIGVPVAVYREMDLNELNIIAKRGKKDAAGGQNRAAWSHIEEVSGGNFNHYTSYDSRSYKDDSRFTILDEILTPDRTKMHGVALDGKGDRYGVEFYGLRRGGWGSGEHAELLNTPHFLALKTNASLKESIAAGLAIAIADKRRGSDQVRNVTYKEALVNMDGLQGEMQMLYWMREGIEMALFDYIFSQQDRIGNVDYTWEAYWIDMVNGDVDDKRVKPSKELSKIPREEINYVEAPSKANDADTVAFLQRTELGDNDAAGMIFNANWAKKTGWLEGMWHFSAKTYSRLFWLVEDLNSQGPIWQYLHDNLVLNDAQLRQVGINASMALDILKSQCEQGMRFDLDNPKDYMLYGAQEVQVNCSNPSFTE